MLPLLRHLIDEILLMLMSILRSQYTFNFTFVKAKKEMRISAPESAATSLNLFDISFAFNAIMAWDVQVSESTEDKSI